MIVPTTENVITTSSSGALTARDPGTFPAVTLAHVATALALFCGVALLDLVVDRDLSLYALYLVPALFSTWFLGIRWGYATCVASALVWLADDAIQLKLHHTFASSLNLLTRATVLAFVVALVYRLKCASEESHAMANRHVNMEMDMARGVQLRLLPAKPPSYPGLDLSCLYVPAMVVGGDYYDFLPVASGQLGIAVGDVSGKGLPGALLMASLQGLMRSSCGLYRGKLASFVEELNASLYSLTASNRFATLVFGVVDTENGTFEYVNAGHNPPLLFRSTPSAGLPTEELNHGGVPLGIAPKRRYQQSRVFLHEGDVLVMYTDGVTEAQNVVGEEFGEDRLRHTVANALGLTAAEISDHVKEDLRAFVGERSPVDDITLVILKVRGTAV